MTEALLEMICRKYHTAGLSFGEEVQSMSLVGKESARKGPPLGWLLPRGDSQCHLKGLVVYEKGGALPFWCSGQLSRILHLFPS